jgi:hypothetical protein
MPKTKTPMTAEQAIVILRQLIDEKDQQIIRLQKALAQADKRERDLIEELNQIPR